MGSGPKLRREFSFQTSEGRNELRKRRISNFISNVRDQLILKKKLLSFFSIHCSWYYTWVLTYTFEIKKAWWVKLGFTIILINCSLNVLSRLEKAWEFRESFWWGVGVATFYSPHQFLNSTKFRDILKSNIAVSKFSPLVLREILFFPSFHQSFCIGKVSKYRQR